MLDQVPSVTKVNQVGDILREFATMTTASTARRFSLAQTLEGSRSLRYGGRHTRSRYRPQRWGCGPA
jgi:hypothetical protein